MYAIKILQNRTTPIIFQITKKILQLLELKKTTWTETLKLKVIKKV